MLEQSVSARTSLQESAFDGTYAAEVHDVLGAKQLEM